MSRMTRWGTIGGLILVLSASGGMAASDRQSFELIERGRYLAVLGDCAACHTNPGDKPYAGGRPLETPFGRLVAPNLTPDRETGIGAWPEDEFVAALQEGRGHGGEHLYPAMPYTYYTRITRDDAIALRAFLGTLEPVHNEVASNQLPFPFNIRETMVLWKQLFFKPGTYQPDPKQSEEWNRGAYLVEGLGHCGMCHTPKNFLGADKTSETLQGAVLQGWFAPNLTTDARRGIGSWSVEDLVGYLKTGRNRVTAATGPMAEVVTDSTSQMNDDDLRAMAVYLKARAAEQSAAPKIAASDDRFMRAGEAIYVDNCAACHTKEGTGLPQLFPALKGSPSVMSDNPRDLIRVVLQGAEAVGTDAAPTAPAMPALDWKLSDDQIAAVVTYIRNSWGNAASAVSAQDVRSMRDELAAAVP